MIGIGKSPVHSAFQAMTETIHRIICSIKCTGTDTGTLSEMNCYCQADETVLLSS